MGALWPCLPCMAGLSARTTPRGLSPWPLAQGLGWIARRWARRGARGLLHLLPQLLDRRLQRCYAALQREDVPLCCGGEMFPSCSWEGELTVHGQRFYAASTRPGTGVSP